MQSHADKDAAKELPPRRSRALGRGLSALIPGAPPSNAAAVSQVNAASQGMRVLPIERLHPNRGQPRKHFDEAALADLASSIKVHGVLLPIVARKKGSDYEIVAGERRWRAASLAGLQEVPVLVKELSDATTLQVALIENIQRQDLDPLEEASAYGRLVREYGLTHEALAEAMGKSRSAISNSLRLLKLPESVLALLAEGRLTAGHARALMTLESPEAITALAADIDGRRMSVRDAEAKARQMQRSGRKRQGESTATRSTPAEASVEERLRGALGCKVRLKQRQGRGRVEVFFNSLDELDGLLDKLVAN